MAEIQSLGVAGVAQSARMQEDESAKEELKALLVEFFDFETDTSQGNLPRQLEVGTRALHRASDVGFEVPLLNEMLQCGLRAVDEAEKLTQGGADFLNAALRYTRQRSLRHAHHHAYIVATAKSRQKLGPSLYQELAPSSIFSANLVLAKTLVEYLPTDSEQRILLEQAILRLSGKVAYSLDVGLRVTSPRIAFARALGAAFVQRQQTPLVEYLRSFQGSPPIVQLLSFLVAQGIHAGNLHSRIQSPRKVVREAKMGDSLEGKLGRAAIAIEEFPSSAGALEFAQWSTKFRQTVEELIDPEYRLIAWAAALSQSSAVAGHNTEFFAQAYRDEARAISNGEIDDPYGLFHSRIGTQVIDYTMNLPLHYIRFILSSFSATYEARVAKEVEALAAFARSMRQINHPFGYKRAGNAVNLLWLLRGELPQEFERYFFAPKTGAKPEHDASQTPIPVAGDSVAAGAFSQIFLMNETINGVRCCVKLQRPEIEKALPKLPPRVVRNRAFRAMTSHSNLSDIFNLWDSMVHDLMHQCDFQREAETQDALHKLHANDPLVFTPAVDLARSNRKMIVQEYVSDHIDIFTFGRHSQQFERNRIGEALVRWMFRSLKAGYYYPEMLPGNLLFAKGRVAIVDYGMAREVGDGVGTFVGLWTALRFGDDERIRAETMAMGFTPNSPRFDWKTYIRRLRFEYFAPLLSNHPIVIDRAFVTKMIHGQRRTDLALGCQIPEGPRAFNVFFFWNFMGILGVLGAEAPWGTVIEEVLSLGD